MDKDINFRIESKDEEEVLSIPVEGNTVVIMNKYIEKIEELSHKTIIYLNKNMMIGKF